MFSLHKLILWIKKKLPWNKNKLSKPKPKGEQSFFAVEWSKSPEAKLSEAFEDYDEGLKFAAQLLDKTYGLAGKKERMSQTTEILAMSNILKRIGITRDTIQAIYPHPKKKGAVLVEKKDGCVFEISAKDKIGCKRIGAKDPLLDFWHADDKILFPEEGNFYL